MALFYLAGRFSRRFEFQGYRADLQRLGHQVSSRWIDSDGEDEGEGAAVRDVQDVELADGIIAFLEAPRTPTRGGRHVEFGIAAAEGKRLIAVGPERENVFYFLPEVEMFRTWQDVLVALAPTERLSLRDVWAGPSIISRRAA